MHSYLQAPALPFCVISHYSLLEGRIVELDVVVPDGSEAGQHLGEWRHDQVLAVSEKQIII